LKILFFQFSFFNYFTRSLRHNFLLSLRAPKMLAMAKYYFLVSPGYRLNEIAI